MTHTELFHTYLRHDTDKNLAAIADEVHLRNWNISLCGKEEAIQETVKNLSFKSANLNRLDVA